jgi:hypothetical protein
LAGRVSAQIDGARGRQHLTLGQVVVQEQPGADHPHRPHPGVVRHHEAQRPHDVRRALEQHLALGKRLAHQRELVVLEVAQAAVNELGAARRGVLREIVFLAQHDPVAAASQVARDARAVDAAADHEHVAGLRLRVRLRGRVERGLNCPGGLARFQTVSWRK